MPPTEDRRAATAETGVLLADQTAFEDDDLEAARTKGYGFARIQRYAVEHLLGVS